VIRQTALAAEPVKWSPPEGSKWEEKDYELELKKLEKEAEERLDKKIDELMSKIETTGAN
jgi:RecB family endonuclease NucS